jgi:hypothetical protein
MQSTMQTKSSLKIVTFGRGMRQHWRVPCIGRLPLWK